MTALTKRGRGKSARSLELIAVAKAILQEIQPASVRAVCYQLFVKGVIDNMSKAETNRVSTQLRDAREAGTIPWEWIVDETREAECISAWANRDAYFRTVQRSYRRDRWLDQPERVEVWSEKGTVRGTLAPILNQYGVTFRVMHGYTSSTTAHQVAEESLADPRPLLALYVGDYDPSGLHMSGVDLPRRLTRYGGDVTLMRVALTKVDIIGTNIPSFATETKQKDPRYRWYLERFGARCWELDALNPVILRDRVEQAILDRLDVEAWKRADVVEQAERDSIANILGHWPGISGQASI